MKLITIMYEEFCEDPQLAIAILEHHRKELRTLRQTFTSEEQILRWLMMKNDAEQFTITKRTESEIVESQYGRRETHRTNRGKGTLIYH